jgi:hypothetical protein
MVMAIAFSENNLVYRTARKAWRRCDWTDRLNQLQKNVTGIDSSFTAQIIETVETITVAMVKDV